MNTELRMIGDEEKKDMARMKELRYLFSLLEDDIEENTYQDNRTTFKILRGLEELKNGMTRAMSRIRQVTNAIIKRQYVKARFQLISQLINRKKLDEREQTNQISNRLKREARVFQVIKYSNHLVSIFPILQTMNYIEA